MDDLQFIATLPLFEKFEPKSLKELWGDMTVKAYGSGDIIIPFGQPGKVLGVVLDGRAEACVTDDGGRIRRLGVIERGGIFGEMSLLTGEPTSADVVAVNECRVALITHEAFSRHLSGHPQAIRFLGRLLSERLKSRQGDTATEERLARARKSVEDPYGLTLQDVDPPMHILVMDHRRTSLKYALFDTADPSRNLHGLVVIETASDHHMAFGELMERLTAHGVSQSIDLVAHRVSFGGERQQEAMIIDQDVLREIESTETIIDTDNRYSAIGITASMKHIPGVPQVAVFDTAFHQTMPPQAYLYGIPYRLYEDDRVRRYGYHGISHKYVALKAAAHLKRPFGELKLITCHLGGGASVCAIDHGRSIDTSMGLSPIEGLLMSTRPGDLDPLVITYLLGKKDLSRERVLEILGEESGLRGISGLSGDMLELQEEAEKGNRRALLAISAFCYRLRKYIGSYFAALGGLDALIFSGRIGVNAYEIRWRGCQGLGHMGIVIDDARNRSPQQGADTVAEISEDTSGVRILVIPDDPEAMIARDAVRALGYLRFKQATRPVERPIPIGVSAHHVHLSAGDVEGIFGDGHELTHHADLTQPGQFACAETVALVGPKGTVERVRVLGPARSESQVEISRTEQFKLGVDVPIRQSGDLDGTPGVTLEGSAGRVDLEKGVICAARHIHMSPEDALAFGVRDRDMVTVRVEGERSLTFGDVVVRVNPNFKLEMHVDTDEANAAMIGTGAIGHIESIRRRT